VRRKANIFLLFSNITIIILGILNYFSIDYKINEYLGIIMSAILILDYLSVYFFNYKQLKAYKYPKVFLYLSIIGFFMMMVGNVLRMNYYDYNSIEILRSRILTYAGFIVIFGGAIFNNLKTLSYNKYFRIPKESKLGFLKYIFAIINILILTVLVFVLYSTTYLGSLEIYFPHFAFFFAFIGLSYGLIMYSNFRKRKVLRDVGFVVGVIFFMLFSIPMLSTVLKIDDFTEKYGSVYSEIPVQENMFSLTDYFLGTKIEGYSYEKDVLFYKDEKGNDDFVELKFDYFYPENSTEELPVLLRIHGGSWISGNKGFENMMQMNKYFASKGYAVFDIQYGLYNFGKESDNPRKGNFTIEDLVRHIGLFANHISVNREDYNVDLDNVFVSGGSAGGHLATAFSLAKSNLEYKNDFLDDFVIKGVIPFYPANGLADDVGMEGIEAYNSPTQMIEENQPPFLIYHGTHDGFVSVENTKNFVEKYKEKNNNVVALYFPYSGHANDIYFEGYYNQIFMNYMENFMKQKIKD
jgi:acetyl esterase/lipase